MKVIQVSMLLLLPLLTQAQLIFDEHFTDRTMRFDFILAGNSESTKVFPVSVNNEPFWGGSLQNLTDPFNYGNFRYEVFDAVTGTLLYSKGFCTLYQEWQTTAEAKRIEKSFHEVATFPFPKNKVRFVLSIRGRDGLFTKLYETAIDPASYFIINEKPDEALATRIYGSGDPHTSLDIAFLSEGYTKGEMGKFRADVKRMADILFEEAPFDKYRERINIWAVEAPSQESGTDVPGEGIYVNTALNSSYYTFDVDRYLTTQDIRTVNDYAAAAPHDQIVVLINSPRYGGGGVYNYYSAVTSDHKFTPQVFTHEFGHGFAGLADEYYSSEVAYEEFYPLSVEPWEPNITTMVNFESKWKDLIARSVPVPTPNTKKYTGVTGLFEGGGYSAKGIFRPSFDCRMKSNEAESFCEVCQRAVEEMILFYLE
ncbi:MAG: IgA Peptidase M64 [Bacteroidales bacterium]|nr:IgA Peptidase M64 [Bacteroidales bacterium]